MKVETKSYRSVPMAPIEASASAARFVGREWGSGYRIGLAGVAPKDADGFEHSVYWFQVAAGDGSRFLVWADHWGNVGVPSDDYEVELGITLDVEVSGVVR